MSETSTPERFRCIVVAMDFSAESVRALAWGSRLAADRGAELRLVHAIDPDEGIDWLPALAGGLDPLLDFARTRLAELARPLRERVRSVTYEAVIGSPAHAIVHEADSHQAELLVMGTRGLRGLPHLALGSTAQRVMASAARPVLVVHADDPLPVEGSWRVLAATDGSEDAKQATRFAAALLTPAPTIDLLRAFEPPPVFYSGMGDSGSYELIEIARRAADELLQEEARTLATDGIEACPLLRQGFAPQEIVAAAAEQHADLIVMGTRGRGGLAHLLLGSTAERVAQRAAVPVLVVPHCATPALQHAAEALAIAGAPGDEQC